MKVDTQPFLYLPFSKQNYQITEGWRYSDQEKAIHGLEIHAGVDYKLLRSTPVLAAADGWSISSYFGYLLKKDGQPVLYQGKEVGFGLGYFVQIYHPKASVYTTYGHLEKVDSKVKFHAPKGKGDYLWPVGHKVNPEKLDRYGARWVKRGEVVGYVGDSGLTWGYKDYPQRPDLNQLPSWDEVHLHFEVFERKGSRKAKKYYDPYGIKGKEDLYPDFFNNAEMGGEGPILWVLGEDGLPKFSD